MPAILNNCTIDWYDEWDLQALTQVREEDALYLRYLYIPGQIAMHLDLWSGFRVHDLIL